MLVLSRKENEEIKIGDDVTVTVVRIGPNAVRLGITAPQRIQIARGELLGQTSRLRTGVHRSRE